MAPLMAWSILRIFSISPIKFYSRLLSLRYCTVLS